MLLENEYRPKLLVIVSLAEHLINTDIKEEHKMSSECIIKYIKTVCEQQKKQSLITSSKEEEIAILMEFSRNPLEGEAVHHFIDDFVHRYKKDPEEVIVLFVETIAPDKQALSKLFHEKTYQQFGQTLNRIDEKLPNFGIWMKLNCQDEGDISPDEIWENDRNKYFLID